jgi:hypothetical protein
MNAGSPRTSSAFDLTFAPHMSVSLAIAFADDRAPLEVVAGGGDGWFSRRLTEGRSMPLVFPKDGV